MSTDSSTRLVATIRGAALAVLGAIVLGFAVIELMSIYAFVENARRTEGLVVALTAGPAHSQVQFVDPHTGEQNTFPGNGLGASHRVGDRVMVLWLRRDGVIDARLNEPGPLWGFSFLTGATGLILMIGGVLVLRRRSSERGVA